MNIKRVIFFDIRVAGYENIIANLNEEDSYYLLDANEDGIKQIQNALSGCSNLQSIHVVSHGSEGELYLGSTILSRDNLQNYNEQLTVIGTSLAESGDILLYGCNVGLGIVGYQFIKQLSDLTGGDVAASADISGPIALGGNSSLEVLTGNVEASALDMNNLANSLALNSAPQFSLVGITTTLIGAQSSASGIAVQPIDYKRVVYGSYVNASGVQGFVLVRYQNDGTLDNTFGSGGIVTGASAGLGNKVSLQADGKILIAGTVGGDIGLARFDTNGNPDTTFGTSGKVSTSLSASTEYFSDMAIQVDGKIVVAGTVYNGTAYQNDFALIRYNSDGTLDTTFGTLGKVILYDSGYNESSTGVIVQPDGKILVAGTSSFYSNGQTHYKYQLHRFNSNGSSDTSFGANGYAGTLIDTYIAAATSVAYAGGGLVVSGYAYDINGNADILLLRYNSNGSLDTSFGVGGKVFTAIGPGTEAGRDVVVQADGKIIVAGYAFNAAGNYDFAVVRYNANGSLDTSFGIDGKVTTKIGNGNDYGFAVALQPDERIVVTGYYTNSDGANEIAVVRYNNDGTLDTRFSNSIVNLSNQVGYSENGSAVVMNDLVGIYDPDLTSISSYAGSTLTLSRHGGANAEDLFSGAGIVSDQASGNVVISNMVIGDYSYDSGQLVIHFNGPNASQQLVSLAMQELAYGNSSDTPPATVQIDWLFDDGNTGSQGIGGALSVAGVTYVAIARVNDVPSGSVMINGTVAQGQTLTASNSLVDPDGLGSITYTWYSSGSGTPIGTGVSFTPTQALVGNSITVKASYTDGQGSLENVMSATTVAVVNTNDSPTGSVVLSGTANRGQTLTASNTLADADGLGVITYQWRADGSNIAGATSNSFTLAQAQIGKTITVVASYDDAYGYSEAVSSAATAPVSNNNNLPSGSVVISGTVTQGQTLTASNTVADADGLGVITYQWRANGTNISGATGNSFTLTQAQVGKAITVVASYTDLLGATESVTSSATSAVANVNDAPTGGVSISGAVTQGQTLTASNSLSDLDGLGPVSYTWKTSFDSVSWANVGSGGAYILGQSDVGKFVKVTAQYTDLYGTLESVDSSSPVVANVNDSPSGSVSIEYSGLATVGKLLTVSNTLSDADGLGSITYQWKADGVVVGVGISYSITDADLGKAILVTASYVDGYGYVEHVNSSPTNTVVGINEFPTFYLVGTIFNASAGNTDFVDALYCSDGSTLLVSSDGLRRIDQTGLYLVDIPKVSDYFKPTAASLLADGKYLVSGWVANASNGQSTGYAFIERHNADGSIDTTFGGGDGFETFNVGVHSVSVRSIAIRSDGNIDLVGFAENSYYRAGFFGKVLTPTGQPSDTISGNYSGSWYLDAAPFENSSNILLLSSSTVYSIKPNSTLDTAFGTSGLLTIPYNNITETYGVANSSGGGFFVFGTSVLVNNVTKGFGLAKITSTGALDTTFSSDGFATADFSSLYTSPSGSDYVVRPTDLIELPDGKILVSGYSASNGGNNSYWRGVLAQFNADGTLDLTFGHAGLVTYGTLVNSAITSTHLSLGSDGTILVTSNNDITRFKPDGTLDISFGGGDTFISPISVAENQSYSIASGGQIYDDELSRTDSYNGTTLTIQRHGAPSSDDLFAKQSWFGLSELIEGGDVYINDATDLGYPVTKTVLVGHVQKNSGGVLSIQFDGVANQYYVTQVLRSITYTNKSDTPPSNVVLDISFDDGNSGSQGVGGALSTTIQQYIQIVPENDGPTGEVLIVGNSEPGSTLTIVNTLADADGLGSFAYQWMADGVDITGAISSSYAVALSDLGKILTLRVSYVDQQGNQEVVISSATPPVNRHATGLVLISGAVTQGQTLTASNTLADADGLGVITYQWRADGSNIAGATGNSFTLTQAQVGKAITVVASYTDLLGATESVTSSATSAVANVNDAPTGGVSISGTVTQGQALTASNTLADADGLGVITYQWRADGSNIAGATGNSFTLTQAQVGKAITVVASYTDLLGATESVTSSATSAVANVNDAPTGGVSISGTVTQGQTLTASNTLADADGLGVITYQWRANGTNISGATGNSFTLTQAQVGKTITLIASYTDLLGTTESLTSAATTSVVNINDQPSGTLRVSGTFATDQVLRAFSSLSDLDGMGVVTYTWSADGVNVGTGISFILASAYLNKSIRVAVTYTDLFGAAESVTATIPSSTPLGSKFYIGSALTDTLGDSTSATSLWIYGAEGQDTLVGGHGNDILNGGSGYDLFSFASSGNAVDTIIDFTVGDEISITGFTSSAGPVFGIGTGLLANQLNLNIDGGVTHLYIGTDSSPGYDIEILLSGVFSPTQFVVSESNISLTEFVNSAPTGGVSISGTVTQGQTLTASNTLADADGLGVITYQWRADGSNIVGATGNSFTLTQAQVGKAITVVASYTDLLGATESVTSSATSAVANVNDAPTGGVSISGTVTQGQTLTASNTLADADGLGVITYQWRADGSNIAGATGNSFTLTQAQVGKAITVVASYTDLLGTTESLTSAASSLVTDLIFPTLLTAVPADNATSVYLSNNLALTFSESVFAGLGNIVITNLDNASDTRTISVGDSSQVSISGATVTINPTANLLPGAHYAINLNAGVIVDGAGNGYAGISGNTALDFTAASTANISGNVYYWKTHALIDDVAVAANDGSSASSSSGHFALNNLVVGDYTLNASRTSANDSTGSAITSADALAALKIAVGINPNADPDGAGPRSAPTLSPYQLMAADINGDGIVSSADALAILKMAVQLPTAATPTWVFADEAQAYNLTSSNVHYSTTLSTQLTENQSLNLVATLKGDVNGSWGSNVALTGQVEQGDPSYFANLAAHLNVSQDVWGVTDYIISSSENDSLTGSSGSDRLNGGGGNDLLSGGLGDDVYFIQEYYGGNDVIQDAGGNDVVLWQDFNEWNTIVMNHVGNDLVLNTYSIGHNSKGLGYWVMDSNWINGVTDPFQVTTLKDFFTQSGFIETFRSYNTTDGACDFKIVVNANGDANNNIVIGTVSSDTYFGGSGIDIIDGQQGDDHLYGDDGNDQLVGGSGSDVLTGGSGADSFVFQFIGDSTTLSPDVITDFDPAAGDKIDLGSVDANWNDSGWQFNANQNNTFHYAGSTATANSVWYGATNGGIILYGDADGNTTPDFAIKLLNISTITANSIVL